MRDVTSEQESVFDPRRLITENALIDFECINSLKQYYMRNKGNLALKLDMSKAYYDKVDNSYFCVT